MTHEELLALIGKMYENENCGSWICEANYKAVKSVMELHKPVFAIANGVEGPKYCQQCAEGRGYADYPCPTIQAIQEQLK